MERHNAYCPGCDRPVRLVLTDGPPRDGHANLPDGEEWVCLDFESECTGGRCPLTGRAGIVMGVRLARSRLRDRPPETVPGRCEYCGGVSRLEVVDPEYAYCTLCERVSGWVLIELPDGTRVAVTDLENGVG